MRPSLSVPRSAFFCLGSTRGQSSAKDWPSRDRGVNRAAPPAGFAAVAVRWPRRTMTPSPDTTGEPAMPAPLESLDSPQLLIDLVVLDATLERMLGAGRGRPVVVRVHFKSLKCGGLARYLSGRGVARFLCAKLNEAEVLADAGIADLFVANQVVG